MNPRHPIVGTLDHIDLGQLRAPIVEGSSIRDLIDAGQLPPPKHWPPRLTRMALAVRLGTTRMLLERRP